MVNPRFEMLFLLFTMGSAWAEPTEERWFRKAVTPTCLVSVRDDPPSSTTAEDGLPCAAAAQVAVLASKDGNGLHPQRVSGVWTVARGSPQHVMQAATVSPTLSDAAASRQPWRGTMVVVTYE